MVLRLLFIIPRIPLVPKLEAGLPQDVGGEEDGGEGGDVGLQAAAPQAVQVLLQVVPLPPPH